MTVKFRLTDLKWGKFLTLSFGLFLTSTLFSQTITNEECGASKLHKERMQNSATYNSRMQNFENQVANFKPNKSSSLATYRIPVVVHVIEDGTILTAITDDQIRGAIQNINERYRKTPGTLGDGNGVDIGFEFALAVRDPNGNCTNGITRYNFTSNSAYMAAGVNYGSTGSGVADTDIKSLVSWDQSKYYNIWLVSEIDNNNGGSGIQGYAYMAGSHGNVEDGALILASKFKLTTSGTATHELGHAFNLFHTFEGDDDPQGGTNYVCPANATCSTDGDKVCDTPPHIRSASTCPAGQTNSCDGGSSTELYYHNYMDYSSYSCKNEFTAGQRTRVLTTIATIRGSFLEANGNLALVPPSPPTPDFTISTTTTCVGSKISFKDISSCIPNTYLDTTSWPGISFNWTFTNNNGTTYNSNNQNPTISFMVAGTYDVTLTITNTSGSNSTTKKGALVVTSSLANATCNPSSSYTGTIDYGIFEFNLNTINHISGSTYDDNLNGTTVNGYGNLSCSESTVLIPNKSYTVSLKGSSNNSNTVIEDFKLYIDYNNDGDFVDLGEEVATWDDIPGNSGLLSRTFTTPANPTVNTFLRMRVISVRGNTETATPCIVTTRGQAHDFGVFISTKIATVSIAASNSSITYGSNVTFTATPTNGGSTPAYKWYLNGNEVNGQTTATYSNSSLLNGDQISCVLYSNLSNVIGSPTTSNTITMSVTGKPLSDFTLNDTLICLGNSITLTDASLLSPTTWNWTSNGGTIASSSSQNTSISFASAGMYTVTLIASNGIGTGTTKSKKIHVLTTPTGHCTTFTRTNPPTGGIGITNVKINEINKTTTYNDAVYQDFSCSDKTQLYTATRYPLSVKVSSSNPQWIRVYIDFNNNGLFTDTGETVYTTGTLTANNVSGTIDTAFTTPANPTLNTLLKMRVVTDFGSNSGSGPCKNPIAYGQVEDYGIIMRTACTNPSITAQSTATQTVCLNGSFTPITVTASGSALTYQWYSNTSASNSGGTSINAATNSTYTPIATSAGTKYYYCTVTGSCGTAVTSTISGVFIVNAANAISAQSTAAQTVCLNATFTPISVTASGTALTYQWYSNTSASNSGGTSINAATNSTYTPLATSAGTNYYYCTVSGSCGAAVTSTISGAFIVNSANTITAQSTAAQTVCLNSSFTPITITASGTALTYQWFSNTSASNSGGTSINTATNPTYTPLATTAGTKYYYCTVSGSCGGAVTSTISGAFIVNPANAISAQSTAAKTVCLNATFTPISVTASGTALTYQWYSNTSASNSGGTSINAATNSTYTPLSTSAGTNYYYCTVSGSCGSAVSSTISGAFIVNSANTISAQSTAAQTVCLNATFTPISVTASGTALTYQWFSNTSASNSGGTSINAATNSTYTPLATSAGTKYYYCTVSGSCGAAVTSTISGTFIVNTPTAITTQSTATQTVGIGGVFNSISVTATGTSLTYQWYSNSTNTNSNGTPINAATNSTYTPLATNLGTTYYYCIVSGTCGISQISSASGAFIVNSSPSILGDFTVCLNETSQLSGTGIANSSTPWISSDLNVATVSSTGLITPLTAGNTFITYTNNIGDQVVKTITINALPTLTNLGTICENSMVQAIGTGTPNSTTPWNSSNLNVATISNTGLISGISGGITTITYTDDNSCQATISATINAQPTKPSVQVINECDSTQLIATAIGTLHWSTNETKPTIKVHNSGKYTVYQIVNGCESLRDTVTATPKQNPTVTLASFSDICKNGPSLNLTGGLPINGVYSGNGVNGNQFNPTSVAEGNYVITYTFTTNEGCSASDTSILKVKSCAGIVENTLEEISIYPNPTTNSIKVTSEYPIQEITLFDTFGRYISTQKINSNLNEMQLDLSELNDGFYILEVYSNYKTYRKSITKIK